MLFRSKHVSRKYHLIRQFVGEGQIRLCKVHTDMNVSDLLTKTLSLAKHVQHREAMCVKLLLQTIIIDSSASGRLLEICPRDNNKCVIIHISVS